MKISINKHALTFGFISVFLTGMGLTIVIPVLPVLVKSYTSNPSAQATAVTLLSSIYALSVFLAAPVLGALSDRYGRRPVLIISLLGSALGYFVFGLGGALWVLFLGRIIEGLTGGEYQQFLLTLLISLLLMNALNTLVGLCGCRGWDYSRSYNRWSTCEFRE